MNEVKLSGRLVSDLELRYTPKGTPVMNGCIAVWRGSKISEGQQNTDFINIRSFSKKLEEKLSQFNKGVMVELKGSLRADQYTKDGQKKTFNYVLVWEMNIKEKQAYKEQKPQQNGIDGIDLNDLPL